MRIVLCGMGNPQHGDDGFGPFLAGLLLPTESLVPIDCGLQVENYLGKIAELDPAAVILADAVQGLPAPATVLRNDAIAGLGGLSCSSHALATSALVQFLREQVGAEVLLVGARLTNRVAMSDAVRALAERVAGCLNALDIRPPAGIVELYESLLSAL